MHMASRRSVLAGVGVSLASVAGFGTAVAQQTGTENETDLPVYITNVDERAETFEIVNRGSEAVDLSNYRIDLEYDQPDNQIRSLGSVPDIPAGGSVTVETGATDASADVSLGYSRNDEQINNSDPDTIALLSPDGDLVRTSDEEPPAQTGGTGGGSSSDGGTESTPSDGDDGGQQGDAEAPSDSETDASSKPDSGAGSDSATEDDAQSDQSDQRPSSEASNAGSGSPDCPPPEPPEDC